MSKLICPVDNAVITSNYGMRLHPISKKYQKHAGVDLKSSTVAKPPIYATYDGTVIKLVKNHDSYGNYLMIEHLVDGKKLVTLYAHLDSLDVVNGKKVKTGDKIGVMGKTGTATGIHLHFEIHQNSYSYGNGNYPNSVDPMTIISLKYDRKAATSNVTTVTPHKVEQPKEQPKVESEMDIAWKWAVQNGLLQDINRQQDLTRNQLATVLHRFAKKFL